MSDKERDQTDAAEREDTESILSRRRFLIKGMIAGAAVALCATETACPCLSPREPVEPEKERQGEEGEKEGQEGEQEGEKDNENTP